MDLIGLYKKRANLDEVRPPPEISKEELLAAQNVAMQEKKRAADLQNQVLVIKHKCDELENNSRILTEMIANKDQLISKLWDELLAIKNKPYIDKEKLMQKIDEDIEVSSEGKVGFVQGAIGKTLTQGPNTQFQKALMAETLELKKLKSDLAESQGTCKVLNERLKEINELYMKLENDVQELREKIRSILSQNANLTSQLVKAQKDKEIYAFNISQENQELMKKLEMCEITKTRDAEKYENKIMELNQAVEDFQGQLSKVLSEKRAIVDENTEIKAEIKDMVNILKKKDMEIRILTREINDVTEKLEESQSEAQRKYEYSALVSANTELKNKIKELKHIKIQISEKKAQELIGKIGKFDENSVKVLVDVFGEASTELFLKIHGVVSKYKAKCKYLKAQILEIKQLLENKNSEMNGFYRKSPRQTLEEKEKFPLSSEIFLNSNSANYMIQIEKLKLSLEKQKITKRRALAENEQLKEDLAHNILTISELQMKILELRLDAKDHDFLAFINIQSLALEQMILNKKF